MNQQASSSSPSLRRALGKWDLTAIGVNQVIGGAVFSLPAVIAMHLGSWSWVAFALVALLSMAVALNFAEAGSRFDGTGGPYLYTRAAFGRFLAFEVGWMTWFVRVSSWASVVSVLTDALGFYFPEFRTGWPRGGLISAVILSIMGLNLVGIKQSSLVLNLLTIGKLTPLALFILLGLRHVSLGALSLGDLPPLASISAAALPMIFAFGGYEVIPVPAGEARNPKKDVPFAMIMAIIIVGIVMTLAQVVTLGTLPALATSGTKTPLADAALLFIGGWGALMMTIGALVSTAGNNVGAALSGSRSLFALAEQGDIPKVFGHVHSRFRTPDAAIITTSLVTLALALLGSFTVLAPISALARLVVYGGTCASVLALRRQGRAPFTIPFGPFIPGIALAVCVAILFGATRAQLIAGGYALAAGAVLYLIATTGKRKVKGQRSKVKGKLEGKKGEG
jgi:APA family basic amino acid/polyamine antiporter